jgi:hypothetical protein
MGEGGFIYAICEEGSPLIKIGHTRNLLQRLGELQRKYSSPLSILGAVFVAYDVHGIEKSLHRRFAEHRIHHEWFALEMDQAYLDRVVTETVQWRDQIICRKS